jgi:hypothetical protein
MRSGPHNGDVTPYAGSPLWIGSPWCLYCPSICRRRHQGGHLVVRSFVRRHEPHVDPFIWNFCRNGLTPNVTSTRTNVSSM